MDSRRGSRCRHVGRHCVYVQMAVWRVRVAVVGRVVVDGGSGHVVTLSAKVVDNTV